MLLTDAAAAAGRKPASRSASGTRHCQRAMLNWRRMRLRRRGVYALDRLMDETSSIIPSSSSSSPPPKLLGGADRPSRGPTGVTGRARRRRLIADYCTRHLIISLRHGSCPSSAEAAAAAALPVRDFYSLQTRIR